jgi:hypothetical protein
MVVQGCCARHSVISSIAVWYAAGARHRATSTEPVARPAAARNWLVAIGFARANASTAAARVRQTAEPAASRFPAPDVPVPVMAPAACRQLAAAGFRCSAREGPSTSPACRSQCAGRFRGAPPDAAQAEAGRRLHVARPALDLTAAQHNCTTALLRGGGTPWANSFGQVPDSNRSHTARNKLARGDLPACPDGQAARRGG